MPLQLPRQVAASQQAFGVHGARNTMKAFDSESRDSCRNARMKSFALKGVHEMFLPPKPSLKVLQPLVQWTGNVNGLLPRSTGISP
jgi:hypothetical protein